MHVTAGRPPIPCGMARFGSCRICELTDRDGPHYLEGYRRLFHPEEFPDLSAAVPAAVIAPQPEQVQAVPSGVPAIPLAGDLVAALAARIGADRAARWVARWLTGVPDCNCPARQAALNALDAKVRRFLRWG